jgi:hypothetical protein
MHVKFLFLLINHYSIDIDKENTKRELETQSYKIMNYLNEFFFVFFFANVNKQKKLYAVYTSCNIIF